MCRIHVMFLVAFVCVCDCKCHGTLVYGIRYAVHLYYVHVEIQKTLRQFETYSWCWAFPVCVCVRSHKTSVEHTGVDDMFPLSKFEEPCKPSVH